MAVMITGGAGFIGLNVAQALLEAGRRVVSFGLEAPSSTFLEQLGAHHDRMAVERGDVCDRGALVQAMQRHDVRFVVHGAAITAGLEREVRTPEQIAAVNFGGTIEVLEAAREHGIQRFVQLSSGAVFGSSVKAGGTLDELLDVPVPESLYGITKYASERLAVRYRNTGRLDLCVARLGTCFGRWEHDTGQRDTLSIPFGLMRLAQARGHAVFRKQLPDDWVYASDVAQGVIRMLDAPVLPQPLYHLSAGRRWSASNWCDRLAGAFPGFSYEVSDEAARVNIATVAPSPRPPFAIDRLRHDLGYAPRFLEEEAFDDYVRWSQA